jgi:hypothetical protein
MDGDAAALLFAPDSLVDVATLAVNDRVRVELSGTRILIHGSAGSSFYTRAQADTAFYTKTQLNAGQLDTRYYTETEVDALLGQAWQPVVPSSVTSTGGTGASRDATTGVITVPSGCTQLNVLGVFASGYEYMIVTRELDSFTAYTDNMNMGLLVGSTIQNAASYYMLGNFNMYDGTNGQYIANATNIMPIGNGALSGGESHRRLLVLQANEALNTLFTDFWNYTFPTARRVSGVGSYNNNAQATGFRLSPGTGSFAATVRVFRRKALT